MNELPADCARRFAWRRELARGGFGAVHEAVHQDLDRPVAVKVLESGLAGDAEQVRRFENEARITASISHPHVIRLLDFGAETGVPWIAYEFVPGSNLRDALAAAPAGLAWARVAEIGVQVAEALQAAHDRGVLHRDIKPENVLLDAAGACVVTDFGIAKWTQSGSVHTKTGVILGTPVYISPEQLIGEAASSASDIYALGVMLFELATGRPPYHGPALPILMEKHLRARIPHLVEHRADAPRELDALLRRALAKAPKERPASARELANELSALGGLDRPAAEATTRAVEAPVRRDTAKTRRQTRKPAALPAGPGHRPCAAAGAGAGALAAALVVALAFTLKPAPPPAAPPSVAASPSVAPGEFHPYGTAAPRELFGWLQKANTLTTVDTEVDLAIEKNDPTHPWSNGDPTRVTQVLAGIAHTRGAVDGALALDRTAYDILTDAQSHMMGTIVAQDGSRSSRTPFRDVFARFRTELETAPLQPYRTALHTSLMPLVTNLQERPHLLDYRTLGLAALAAIRQFEQVAEDEGRAMTLQERVTVMALADRAAANLRESGMRKGTPPAVLEQYVAARLDVARRWVQLEDAIVAAYGPLDALDFYTATQCPHLTSLFWEVPEQLTRLLSDADVPPAKRALAAAGTRRLCDALGLTGFWIRDNSKETLEKAEKFQSGAAALPAGVADREPLADSARELVQSWRDEAMRTDHQVDAQKRAAQLETLVDRLSAVPRRREPGHGLLRAVRLLEQIARRLEAALQAGDARTGAAHLARLAGAYRRAVDAALELAPALTARPALALTGLRYGLITTVEVLAGDADAALDPAKRRVLADAIAQWSGRTPGWDTTWMAAVAARDDPARAGALMQDALAQFEDLHVKPALAGKPRLFDVDVWLELHRRVLAGLDPSRDRKRLADLKERAARGARCVDLRLGNIHDFSLIRNMVAAYDKLLGTSPAGPR